MSGATVEVDGQAKQTGQVLDGLGPVGTGIELVVGQFTDLVTFIADNPGRSIQLVTGGVLIGLIVL